MLNDPMKAHQLSLKDITTPIYALKGQKIMGQDCFKEKIDICSDNLTKKGLKGSAQLNDHDYLIKRIPVYRRTYSRLKERNEMFQVLFETTDDAVFVMKDDEFIDCNHKTLEIFNCSRDQIIGQTPYRFSPHEQYDGIPSEEKAKGKIFTALSGKPLRFEWLHTRYNGEPFNAEVTLNPLDIDGEKYLIAVVRDITECMWARKALLESVCPQAEQLEIGSIDLLKITESLQKGRIFSDPNRFIIMFLLYYNVKMNFSDLQEKLKLTPGNLGHHLKKLEQVGFVRTQKIISWRILTLVSITDVGSKAFENFAKRMKRILYPIG
ncbi:MAG: transcriptional regulator [Candidatus Odinarchaeota archaeon]